MRTREVMTKKRFLAWLLSRNPRSVVGTSLLFGFCPLAKYVQDSGYPEAGVGIVSWNPTYPMRLPLPPWAKKFVSEVDSSGLKRITVKRAIAFLKVS